ncbi:MAG TPA: hypothetical protein VFY03_00430 [Woeseiaceae bacterium]|nr:hypothetical protein [Woeseiaceae bacterium]
MFKPTLAGALAGFTALAATFAFATTPGDTAAPATAAPATAAAPLRIGIVVPKAQLGQGNSGQDVAEPVRQLIMAYMAGPMLELVPLNARVPAQIVAEAEAAGCTHVLYTSVEQKKAKKGLGGMLGAVAPAAGLLTGMGGGGDVASMMAMSAATQAMSQVAAQAAQEQALSTLTQAQAGTVKKKDEIVLEYQLQPVSGGGAPLTEKLSAKADEDGEDLLSPLVEQLATNAVTAVTTPAGVPAATQ